MTKEHIDAIPPRLYDLTDALTAERDKLQAENSELKKQVSDLYAKTLEPAEKYDEILDDLSISEAEIEALRKELEQTKFYLRGVEKERTEFMLQVAEMGKRLEAAEDVCEVAEDFLQEFLGGISCVPGRLQRAIKAWRSQATEEG